MTIEEKAGQLSQFDGDNPQNLEIIKQGGAGSLLNVLGTERVNAAQKIAVEQTRLKIPLIFGFDVIHGYRTIFPVPIASASSFDPHTYRAVGARSSQGSQCCRNQMDFRPRWSILPATFAGAAGMVEGSGEYRYLGSLVGSARIRGFQGTNIGDPQSVVACVKHFAAYGAAEGGRDYNTVDISEQLLREVYLPPFRAAIDAGVGTVMSAFEDLNGVPATANHHTLTDILRNEWKFPGLVVSDYNSVK